MDALKTREYTIAQQYGYIFILERFARARFGEHRVVLL